MNMSVRSDARYAIACVTSMGVRITPEDRMAVQNSQRFMMQATSAETNVLNVASSLGKECLAMTKFVEGSPVAAFIKSQLRARNIAYTGKEVPQGGPWGILHLSGLIAAMSPETTECCLKVAEAAKAHGTLISFDLNYRATFWKGREEELREAFHRIAQAADILVGNEEDFQLCLGFKGPEAGGKDLSAKIESFKGMIDQVREKYPNAKAYATTLRQVVSANEHLWGAILWADGKWYVEEPRPIPVMDRIGGGDGFSGGLLYGVLAGWEPEKWLQFGWASGVLAASSLNDYAEPADEKQVWDIYAGNARVQR